MNPAWRSPHDRAAHPQAARPKLRALTAAFLCTFLAFLIQLAGSAASGSLALLSDTAHLFTDLLSLFFSLFALLMAGRPTAAERSYGWFRLEVLAGFLNGLLLLGVAASILREAYQRWQEPQPVAALPVLLVASAGLALNLISAWFLHRAAIGHSHGHDHGHSSCGHDHSHQHDHGHAHANVRPAAAVKTEQVDDRNLRAAYLHVLSDAMGSVAVIAGAILMHYTGWERVDPVIGGALSFLVAYWAFRLIRDTGHVLLEGTPRHIDLPKLTADIRSADARIRSVEDLHVWEITSRMYALSVYVHLEPMPLEEVEKIRRRVEGLLIEQHGIAHSVIGVKCP